MYPPCFIIACNVPFWSDGVGFEDGGVTIARWWCDGWLVKGSMTTPMTAKIGHTIEIEGMNE